MSKGEMQCDLTQSESHSQDKSLYLHTQQTPKFCWIGQLKYQEFSCRLNTCCGGTKLCRQDKLCALRPVLSHGYACTSHSCRVVSRSMIPEPLLCCWSAITGLTFNLQNKRGAASPHWNWKVPPLRPDICGAQGEFTVTATSVPKQFGVTVPPSQHDPTPACALLRCISRCKVGASGRSTQHIPRGMQSWVKLSPGVADQCHSKDKYKIQHFYLGPAQFLRSENRFSFSEVQRHCFSSFCWSAALFVLGYFERSMFFHSTHNQNSSSGKGPITESKKSLNPSHS